MLVKYDCGRFCSAMKRSDCFNNLPRFREMFSDFDRLDAIILAIDNFSIHGNAVFGLLRNRQCSEADHEVVELVESVPRRIEDWHPASVKLRSADLKITVRLNRVV